MNETGSLKILVLAHDLSDAAIARRVAMLRAGDAEVAVAGFRRTQEPVAQVAGTAAIDFGRTYNAGFLRRIGSVLCMVARLGRYRALFARADVILARNLEMLAIGVRGRGFCHPQPLLIYECLDIHRLLLNRGPVGMTLRALEGWLAKRASALFTSSPAFVEHYFNRLSSVRLPIRLVENKALDLDGAMQPAPPRAPGPPWIIGWFGMIRCRKSFRILAALAKAGEGKIEVVIRGRPSPDIFPDFETDATAMPGLRFLGPYKNPGDLAAIYQSVHFVWAIDMFEEGLNSSWLLPNRLYEGGAFGAVPIAQEDVETGRFLQHRRLGVTLAAPLGEALAAFFRELTGARYKTLEEAMRAAPRETWVCGPEDGRALVAYIKSLGGGNRG